MKSRMRRRRADVDMFLVEYYSDEDDGNEGRRRWRILKAE